MRKKKVVILGSSGSVGESAFDVISRLPEELEVFGIAAYSSTERLAAQAEISGAPFAAVGNEKYYKELSKTLPLSCKALCGQSGMVEMVTHPEVDIVLCAIVGTAGLIPVLEAIKARKKIAIASKEILVMAGEIVMAEAAKAGISFLPPVDSEHSAIFQCLEGKNKKDISKLILTASGGPFRKTPPEKLHNVSYREALNHPTWSMGPKISIDSATLVNKALEVIEAKWLFDVPGENIEVVLHPQSIVHSMVEFIDGTVLAQMSTPDMRFPIQYSLTYPSKYKGGLAPLDFRKYSNLTFELPDNKKFPALDLAHFAMKEGGTMPAVMNAANEIAVERFKDAEIKFTDIWGLIEKTMMAHKTIKNPSLNEIISSDSWARNKAESLSVSSFALK